MGIEGMREILVTREDGTPVRVLLPKDMPESEWEKGIPVSVDLTRYLDSSHNIISELTRNLAKEGLVVPDDFDKPGAYDAAIRAVKRTYKVEANNLVNAIRRDNTHGNS